MTDAILARQVRDSLGATVAELLDRLWTQLEAKRPRNLIRKSFYDAQQRFEDLGIALPPGLEDFYAVLGWSTKAVDHLAARIIPEGFVVPGLRDDSFGLRELAATSGFDAMLPQAIVSSLVHATSFGVVGVGANGDPWVHFASALDATGLWDRSRNGLGSALVITDRDLDSGEPTSVLLATTEAVLVADWIKRDRVWDIKVTKHGLGRCPVEPLVFQPRLGRPFGSSRISRPMMSITLAAMRTIARSEVGAEFFSAPQRWILGADESQFVGADGTRRTTWDLLLGKVLALPDDPEEIDPSLARAEVGQFAQISMQPHTEHLRMWAALFAAEASLPINSLGVVQDQPSSAEAIYASKEDLVLLSERTTRGFNPGLCRMMTTLVQLRDNLPEPPKELASMSKRFADPSTPSRAQATDAVMKQVQAGVLPPESDVALEALGYDQVTIERLRAYRATAAPGAAQQLINALGKNRGDNA